MTQWPGIYEGSVGIVPKRTSIDDGGIGIGGLRRRSRSRRPALRWNGNSGRGTFPGKRRSNTFFSRHFGNRLAVRGYCGFIHVSDSTAARKLTKRTPSYAPERPAGTCWWRKYIPLLKAQNTRICALVYPNDPHGSALVRTATGTPDILAGAGLPFLNYYCNFLDSPLPRKLLGDPNDCDRVRNSSLRPQCLKSKQSQIQPRHQRPSK